MALFLFFSLLFPRLSLFVAWLSGGIPPNNVPLFFDGLGALVFPRMLIMYYIVYADLGTGWLIAHIIAFIVRVYLEAASKK
jgi:hypothetical protein